MLAASDLNSTVVLQGSFWPAPSCTAHLEGKVLGGQPRVQGAASQQARPLVQPVQQEGQECDKDAQRQAWHGGLAAAAEELGSAAARADTSPGCTGIIAVSVPCSCIGLDQRLLQRRPPHPAGCPAPGSSAGEAGAAGAPAAHGPGAPAAAAPAARERGRNGTQAAWVSSSSTLQSQLLPSAALGGTDR